MKFFDINRKLLLFWAIFWIFFYMWSFFVKQEDLKIAILPNLGQLTRDIFGAVNA